MFNFDKNSFENLNKQHGGCVLFKNISSDTITPISAYLKISKKFTHYNFFFESAEKARNKGRFCVIGIDPDLVWKVEGKRSLINQNFNYDETRFDTQEGNVIENLRSLIKESQINWNGLSYDNKELPAICSGIFGYMNYDMVRSMENIGDNHLPDELKIADSIFIRPQILIVFDSLFDNCLICAPSFGGGNYDEMTKKIEDVEKILNAADSFENSDIGDFTFDFTSNYEKEEYENVVLKAKEYIKNGDVFQVLPSQRFVSNYPENLSEFAFYRVLRSVNPSPFLFFLKFDDFALSGSSPEIMVSCQNNKVTIRPLAGTRKRGKNPQEDNKIAQELLSDEKELAEHLMLIDLGRHDVGKVCKDSSVKLTEKMIIEYYSHVMHISSNVEGILRDDLDSLDALISGFPAGTVSGAPKIRAMEIIEELEKVKRSFYAGCVGYFASNGDMETCITLRSSLIKNGKIYLQAGAGVVFDSDPESEYFECYNKARALMKACEML
ncbi:MAG: anthranilate synthase component I [Rickettsiales bacterium]|nr:anthranilate synthase component I [Rickettsiales bacterium]